VRAPVINWTRAGSNRVPEVADVQVQIRSEGELDREFAAIAMVVGKYLTHYDMTLSQFKVAVETESGELRGRSFDPMAARDLYAFRISLQEYFDR